jgi:hypothetical protein
VLACVAACTSPPPLGREDIGYTGCVEIREDGCTLRTDGALRVWSRHPSVAYLDGTVVGRGTVLEVAAAGYGVLEVVADAPAGTRRWSMALRPHDWPIEVEAARTAAREGRAADARAALEALSPLPAEGASLLARLVRSTDPARAVSLLEAAIPTHLERGNLRSAARDIDMLVRELSRQPGGARSVARWLAELPDVPSSLDHAWILQRVAMERAELAGDVRAGEAAAQRALELAERAGSDSKHLDSLHVLIRLQQHAGHHHDAVETAARAHAEAPPQQRPSTALTLAWAVVFADLAGQPTDRDAVPLFRQARARPEELRALAKWSAELGLAWAERHQPEVASARLSALPDLAEQDVELELLARLLRAELSSADALEAAEHAVQLARAAAFQDMLARALHLQGLAQLEAGRLQDAARSLDEAGGVMTRQSRLVPAWRGRDLFVASWDRVVADHVRVLAALGRADDAVRVWRRHRSAYLASLQVSARREALPDVAQAALAGELARHAEVRRALHAVEAQARYAPSDRRPALLERAAALRKEARDCLDVVSAHLGGARPRPLEVGELLVGWIPDDGSGWVFATDATETTLLRSDLEPATMLDPLAARILEASVVRLVPAGPVRLGDLRLRGAAFEADVALDLHGAVGPPPPPDRVLVVADPTRDLPHAREEGAAVAARWRDQGVEVVELVGDAATATRVSEELVRADLFHYAGHGRWDDAGVRGWLPLAEGTALDAAEVLGLTRVPAVVVLAGCRAGRTREGLSLPGLGLAQAFLTAGSTAVLAASDDIPDASTKAWVLDMYDARFARAPGQTRAPHGEQGSTNPFRWMTR